MTRRLATLFAVAMLLVLNVGCSRAQQASWDAALDRFLFVFSVCFWLLRLVHRRKSYQFRFWL